MHFYFIDPHNGVIEKIEGKPSLDQMYKLIDCRLVDFYKPNPESMDGFYLDDEGLFADNTSANLIHSAYETQLNNYVKGKLLYMGTNHVGDSCSPEGTFIYDWFNEDFLGRYLFGDPDKKAVCRLTRMREDDEDSFMTKYTMPLTYVDGKGNVPVTKTLEEKLEELKQESNNQS